MINAISRILTVLTVIVTVWFVANLAVDIARINNNLDALHATLTEMNARQKNVVVTQHKAIEDAIREVCKR